MAATQTQWAMRLVVLFALVSVASCHNVSGTPVDGVTRTLNWWCGLHSDFVNRLSGIQSIAICDQLCVAESTCLGSTYCGGSRCIPGGSKYYQQCVIATSLDNCQERANEQDWVWAPRSLLTAAPTPAPTLSLSAKGDPHLQNIHGERFDLMMPGKHVLVSIPRDSVAEDALLRVEARASKLGGQCEGIYFTELNITGAWAYAKRTGGYHFRAQQETDGTGNWVTMGNVELKIVQGHTETSTRYLNFFVKHLGRTGFAVGGLLGEEDHSDVSTLPAGCVQHVSLWTARSRAYGSGSPATAVAVATFE